jgi:hypothetical protein
MPLKIYVRLRMQLQLRLLLLSRLQASLAHADDRRTVAYRFGVVVSIAVAAF